MLVQSAQLPSELLALDGTEVVARRMARIKEQVTARPDLITMIEKHGLYPEKRTSESLSQIVDEMREAVTITPNEAGKNNADDNTIAFELAYTYNEPAQAQAVAQDLMERILRLDASGNSEQAVNTAQFLQDQANTLDMQIAGLQGQISQITAANGGVLAGGATMIGGSSAGFDVQISSLQNENQQLQSQRQIALTSSERDPVVVAAEQQLAAARAVYAENHPDVVTARQRLAEARQLAKSNVTKLPVQSIDQQIAFNNSQIAALRAAKAQEDAQVRNRLASQARAPLVQQKLSELQQQLTALNASREEVQKSLMAAQAGVRAEDEQMGQRLVVVEPPVIPDEPTSPNRLLILALGIGGGLALGIALALAVEMFTRPIRDPSGLKRAMGVSPLGVVPVIAKTGSMTSPKSGRWTFLRFRRA